VIGGGQKGKMPFLLRSENRDLLCLQLFNSNVELGTVAISLFFAPRRFEGRGWELDWGLADRKGWRGREKGEEKVEEKLAIEPSRG
jgi:hypothetical protein